MRPELIMQKVVNSFLLFFARFPYECESVLSQIIWFHLTVGTLSFLFFIFLLYFWRTPSVGRRETTQEFYDTKNIFIAFFSVRFTFFFLCCLFFGAFNTPKNIFSTLLIYFFIAWTITYAVVEWINNSALLWLYSHINTFFLILWCIRWLSSLFVTLHRKGFSFA